MSIHYRPASAASKKSEAKADAENVEPASERPPSAKASSRPQSAVKSPAGM